MPAGNRRQYTYRAYNEAVYGHIAYSQVVSSLSQEEDGVYTAEAKNEVQTEEPKEVNVMPKKMSRLKDWSISARALKRVITQAMDMHPRYDYKFNAVYDQRYDLYRIWNGATNNVVCTVKHAGGKIILRYRENSYYASPMSEFNGMKVRRRTVVAIPSTNLHMHRGNSSYATTTTSSSREAQEGFRRSCYLNSIHNKDIVGVL